MKELITSRQNPKIKEIVSLGDKKTRKRTGLFRFDGIKLFMDALGRVEIASLVVREPRSEAVEGVLARALGEGHISEDRILFVTESVFEKISEESSPEGIICIAKAPQGLHLRAEDIDISQLVGESLLLAESLRDPGNLGTVIRSCAALGIDRLVLTDDCAELYNPKTVRASMGALFRLSIVTVAQKDMPEFIQKLRKSGRNVYAAALRENAMRVGEFKMREGDCFVIGNEGHGLREEVIAASTSVAMIPMREGNESLNAAAAAVLCIWETVRSL